MSQQNRATIKSYFESGDRPTQVQFSSFIDSVLFFKDDLVIPDVNGHASVGISERILYNFAGVTTIDWENKRLTDGSGLFALTWANGKCLINAATDDGLSVLLVNGNVSYTGLFNKIIYTNTDYTLTAGSDCTLICDPASAGGNINVFLSPDYDGSVFKVLSISNGNVLIYNSGGSGNINSSSSPFAISNAFKGVTLETISGEIFITQTANLNGF